MVYDVYLRCELYLLSLKISFLFKKTKDGRKKDILSTLKYFKENMSIIRNTKVEPNRTSNTKKHVKWKIK